MSTVGRLPAVRWLSAATALTVLATGLAMTLSSATAEASDSYQSLDDASPANRTWMAGLPDDRSLASLSIPGTHDSLALCGYSADGGGTCDPVSTGISQTQENKGYSAASLTHQLDAGVRAIDIRVRVDKGDAGLSFTVHHGVYYQYANVTDVLSRVRDFLAENPRETVLLNLQAECTGEVTSCADADGFGDDGWHTRIFDSYLDGRAYTGDGENYRPATAWRDLFWQPAVSGSTADNPMLGQVRGKIVLLRFRTSHGGLFGGYGLRQLQSSDEYIQDDYDVSSISRIDDKWETARAHLRRTNGVWDTHRGGEREYPYQPDALYLNYTSGSSAGANPYTVAGGTPTATGVNGYLLGCLRGQGDRCPEFYPGRPGNFGGEPSMRRTGITMMDFPGGKLLDAMVARNVS